MGWSSWNGFRVNISEQLIRETADIMVSSGLKRAGYRYVNIDDGWGYGRDENGIVTCRKDRFPSGMKALATYIHKKGLKAGIYTDAGTENCGIIWDNEQIPGYGTYNHEKQDMHTYFIDWGYDFLKVDWCGGQKLNLQPQTQYTKIQKAIKATGKPIFYNICCWEFPGNWVSKVGHSWRIGKDIRVEYHQWCDLAETAEKLAQHQGPGHFNDLDMLQIGQGASPSEDKSHFALWCMLAAPLILGNDLRTMSAQTKAIVTNREAIAINQDPLCLCARRVVCGLQQVWTKPLADKGLAVLLQNKTDQSAIISVSREQLGISSRARRVRMVRDVWSHKNMGPLKADISVEVKPHDVAMIRIK